MLRMAPTESDMGRAEAEAEAEAAPTPWQHAKGSEATWAAKKYLPPLLEP
jgi:hypothetical protein